ncbi:hypothetical protein PHLCEN_2v2473 [Hermanssonia centrifuga]|uniref:GTPase activating protein n=1 Tax=Hermanssonia centrifuga TaxID=98765 RepID=A0A2R6RLY2_9APHY|nr:hypothetical protein PHLCEN_2v2473 [Hermanssonia centrifuga]
MSEEGHPPSAWEHTDNERPSYSPHHTYSNTPAQPYLTRDSLDVHPQVPPTPTRSASPPRSSAESPRRQTNLKWRDSTLPAATPISVQPPDDDGILETSFEENVLRALCDLDCGVPLLLDRIKQSMISCREVSGFLKKRAALEEEYGRNLQKLARSTANAYAGNGGRAGSFVNAWSGLMKMHESVAENRVRFATSLTEMSQELAKVANEGDQERKNTKDLAQRYERALQDAEATTEKSKSRVEVTAEELERVLIQKEGESVRDTGVQGRSPGGVSGKRVIGKAVAKGGLLLKGKNPGNIQRQADDIRARMSAASDAYRKNVTDTQAIRQEYFNFQLPRILRVLRDVAGNLDLGTQYHLNRFAMLFEATVLDEGCTLAPVDDKPGVKSIIESIDNRADFKVYMHNYAFAHGGTHTRGPRREGPKEDGFLPPIAAVHHAAGSPNTTNSQIPDKGRPTFGVDLAEQMARDDVDVPLIMVKCCEAIEKYGLDYQGIYRVGGTVTKVAKLKERLDKDLDSVNLDAEEWSSDISIVTSVLKQWLRELPNPLLTHQLYDSFLDATRNDNERLRHIRLHERVNDLPDPNYATLKYFMGHLHKIVEHEAENSMTVQNIAIVFGPTLFSPGQPGANGHMNGMADAGLQNKWLTSSPTQAIETILDHYTDIFVDEGDE